MQNAQRRQETDRSASASRPSRSVPSDWFLDPADPQAGQTQTTLEDQATAYLAAFDVLDETEEREATVTALHPGTPEPVGLVGSEAPAEEAPSLATWLGVPGFGDTADDGELAWQADALCAQTDPEAFFPEKGGSTRDAKKVCGSCTVRSQCLEYALSNDERFGIWGGMSERERRRLRKKSS